MHVTFEALAGWCYDELYLYHDNHELFQFYQEQCSQSAKEAQPFLWLSGTAGPIVIHYLIQLILFKIIINFIVLGENKYNT